MRVKDADIWAKKILKFVPMPQFHALLKGQDHIKSINNYLCYQNILCMPVVNSPWLAILVDPNPIQFYENSFSVLYHLIFLKMFVRDCAFKTGTQEANRIHSLSAQLDNELNLETVALEHTLKTEIYSRYMDKQINEKNAVFQFIKKLESFTLRFINLLECFLWKALVEPHNYMSLEKCLSLNVILNAKCLVSNNNIDQWKLCINVNQHYFKIRNALYLAATNRKSKDIDYFGYKTLVVDVFSAMQKNNSNTFLYNSYLLGDTAKKYFDMLNVHFS